MAAIWDITITVDINAKRVAAAAIRLARVMLLCAAAVALHAASGVATEVSVTGFGAVGDGRANDRAAIQAAIDTVSYANNSSSVGTVLFPDGRYAIAGPLYVGYNLEKYPDLSLRCRHDKQAAARTPMEKMRRVELIGRGRAQLIYIGDPTDDYLLYFSGQGRGFECIRNLVLDCNYKCRGLFVVHLAYQSAIRNIEIRKSRGIGFDALDCWGSEFSSIMCVGFRGVGMRLHHFNNSTLRNVQFGGSDQGDIPWPDPEETLVRSMTGEIVQVPPERRAALIVSANCATVENVCFEGVRYQRGPAAIYAATTLSEWRQVRFEGNTLPTAKFRLPNYTRQNRFSGVLAVDRADSEVLFDCRLAVAGNEFSRIGGHGNLGSVFRVGDRFVGNRIEVGFVEDVPLGDLGTRPNTVHGSQVGSLEVKPGQPIVSVEVSSGYYGIKAMAAEVTLLDGAALRSLTGGRPGMRVSVFVRGVDTVISRSGNISLRDERGVGDYNPRAGEVIVLWYAGDHWVESL